MGENGRRGGCSISIHALLAESDGHRRFWTQSAARFLSTLSLRRATQPMSVSADRVTFLSTLSLRRATKAAGRLPGSGRISIHALLAESDVKAAGRLPGSGRISIHALLAESDAVAVCGMLSIYAFLSTLSLRRATPVPAPLGAACRYFYPRSPCGERRISRRWLRYRPKFLSTLSLRRATRARRTSPTGCGFLSTLSLRRATGLDGRFKL